jgi:hypothetical protein
MRNTHFAFFQLPQIVDQAIVAPFQIQRIFEGVLRFFNQIKPGVVVFARM